MLSIRSLVIVAIAIAQATRAQNATRTKRGDTAVVATQGNGKWGPPHDAIEVFRVPGDTKQTTFGAVYLLEATPDGGVVLADTKSLDGLIVRQFDANGKFVRNLGRSGPGPGEYQRSNLSIAVSPKGTIYIRDSEKSVSIFGADGKLINSFALFHNNGSTNEIVVLQDGSMHLRGPFSRTGTQTNGLQQPMLHYDVTGKLLDSLTVKTRWLGEGAPGYQWWRTLPDGRILFTRTDKIAFMLVGETKGAERPSPVTALRPAGEVNPDGRPVPMLIAEVPASPVPYLPEERKELQAARDLFVDKCPRGRAPNAPREIVPETKLPSRYSTVDIDGRVWIALTATAQKIPPKIIASCMGPAGSFKVEATYEEPPAFAAFLPDGTYLGQVRFPLRARVTFVGNTAWAVVPDADDVPTLVKYRLY